MGWIILAIVVVLVFIVIGMYNSLVKLRLKVCRHKPVNKSMIGPKRINIPIKKPIKNVPININSQIIKLLKFIFISLLNIINTYLNKIFCFYNTFTHIITFTNWIWIYRRNLYKEIFRVKILPQLLNIKVCNIY